VSNWQKLLPSTAQQPATANSSPAPDSTVQANKDKDTSPAWRILVKQADFKQQKVHLEDLSQSQPVVLELEDFNLKIKDVDSQANSTFNAELDTQVGEHGKLSSNATVTLQPLKVAMSLNSSDLDLRPAQAWISPYARIELRSGLLNS